MNRPYVAAQSGFTLVEVLIVLVLIGLLLSSILWGQELVLNSRSKAVILDMNEIAAAVASYQDRYQALPGDDAMAQTRWNWTAVPAAVPSTPGNRNVDGAYNQSTNVPEPESRLFWWHLRQAGFLRGTTDPASAVLAAQQPTNSFGGITGVTMGAGATTVGLIGLIVCTANIPGKVAIAVDVRLDDGASTGGAVRAQRQAVPNEDLGPAAASYVEDSGAYVLCRTL